MKTSSDLRHCRQCVFAIHAHLVFVTKLALSTLVNSLKGISSRVLRKKRSDIQGHYYKGILWSPSYFAASCGGAAISMIRQYY